MTGPGEQVRRRGEPLLALAAIALCWITIRAFAWQSPWPPALTNPLPRSNAAPAVTERGPRLVSETTPSGPVGDLTSPASKIGPLAPGRDGLRMAAQSYASTSPPAPSSELLSQANSSAQIGGPASSLAAQSSSTQRLPAMKRWRVDGWSAWRQGTGLPLAAPGQPLTAGYGGSQAGILARLDLGSSAIRPQAYLRAVWAPERPRQADFALGVGVRPLERLPVRLQAEGRVTQSAGVTAVRPSVLAVTELPVFDLPLGLQAEGYGQAGWIGGRYSTGFADGQVRVDRAVIADGTAEIRLGVGAWGGAQKFAERVDIGPTVTLDLREGAFPARLSVDYRYQVAGDARPGSGVAVTLSTGF
ncbi:hypothetical protein ACWPM1_04600 [Tsuneonella sp. HG249]